LSFIDSSQEANKSQLIIHTLMGALSALLWRVRVLVVAIALVLTVSHAMATAQPVAPVNTAFAGWLDPDGTATADTVLDKANWEAFTGWKSWGFGLEPVWLRITVPAALRSDELPQVLVVRPPYLDRVTFYDPTTGVVRHAGDFLPAREDALASVVFTFEVSPQTKARDVLVRIESSSTRLVYLEMLPMAEAKLFTRWVEWVTGSFLLVSLFLWVWSVMEWLISRDRVTATFAVQQLMVTLWGFFHLGFARVILGEWFPEGMLSLTTSTVAAVMVGTIFLFFASLLTEYASPAWMLRVMRSSLWVLLGLAVFGILGPTHLALMGINVAATFLMGWLVLTVLVSPKGQPQPAIPKAVILVYVFFYALVNAIPTMTNLGLIQESRILFYGNMSNLVANGFVMLIILGVRHRLFRSRHEAVANQLVLQQEQARMSEQYLSDQRQLLAMLAHEIKTPLANLRIWMEAGEKGRPAMERAIDDMNRVIERCVHSGQLSDQSLQPRLELLDIAELTRFVCSSSRQPERVLLDLPTDPCLAKTDAQILSIVLSNLLDNAYKYSALNSRITLRLTASTGSQGINGWRWQIENEVGSTGWPEASKLFEKYYRSPLARKQSGSGLGLFLVKALLELLDGKVTYSPIDGVVRFEIWLPAQPSSRST
jgi:signal transduction histidine kinase